VNDIVSEGEDRVKESVESMDEDRERDIGRVVKGDKRK